MPFAAVRASAPGKIILAGEHAVVHGTRALATVLDKRTYSIARYNYDDPDTVQLIFHHQPAPNAEPTSISYSWPLTSLRDISAAHLPAIFPSPSTTTTSSAKSSLYPEEPDRDALDASHAALNALLTPSRTAFDRSRLVFLLYFCFLYRARAPVIVELSSELPISAGLGSSASYCASVATALYTLTLPAFPTAPLTSSQLSDINVWAFEGERVLHGNPSGVDNTCIVHGGVILYRRGSPITVLPRMGQERWLIVNTKQPRDTRELVAGVTRRLQQQPNTYRPMIERIDELVGDCISLVNAPEAVNASAPRSLATQLSPILAELQRLLTALGVSHPTIDAVVSTAAMYRVAAKLTGAGGGGCVLCVVRDDMQQSEVKELQEKLEVQGFECLEAAVGQGGVDVEVWPEPRVDAY